MFSGLPWFNLLAGGALIGAGAALLMLCNGRIAGISGIYGRLLGGDAGQDGWQAVFLLGLLLPVWLAGKAAPAYPVTFPVVIVAGLLVGVGTRVGSGCTSGHGVCGIANLSRRSLAATLTFIGMAMLTVFVTRHLIGAGS